MLQVPYMSIIMFLQNESKSYYLSFILECRQLLVIIIPLKLNQQLNKKCLINFEHFVSHKWLELCDDYF